MLPSLAFSGFDPTTIMAPATESRSINLHSLLETGKFSDLKLLCEGHEFAVHKAILCAQSRVFSAACEGGFEVGLAFSINCSLFHTYLAYRSQEQMSSKLRSSTWIQSIGWRSFCIPAITAPFKEPTQAISEQCKRKGRARKASPNH